MCTAIRLIGLSVILAGVVFADDQNKPRGKNITTVFTREGENATLPCQLDPPYSQVFDWKKDRQEVFFYEVGKDYTNGKEGQDLQFKGRVSLDPGGLLAGKASVILSNVTEKDNGVYKCIVLPRKRTSSIQLTMVVDPQVRLTIEEAPLSSDWARISCVSTGGRPQPRGLVLQNQDGVELPAGPATNSTDGSGRYSLHLVWRVSEPGNYTCLALQGDVNPARDTTQYFGNQSSTIKWIIIISVFVLIIIVVWVFF